MRRILSILLALVLGLGPSLAAVPASALTAGWGATDSESQLPACCRKNGAHHCNKSARALTNSSETTISSVGCCPCWPGTLASTAASVDALVHSTTASSATSIQPCIQHRTEHAYDRTPQQTQPKRGPPSQTSI